MPSTPHSDTTCASGTSTSVDAQGHLDPQKGTCVISPEMGGRKSVPELVGEDCVSENIAFSGNCQDLKGINNDVDDTRSNEVRKEDKARKRKVSHGSLLDCESVVQDFSAGGKYFEMKSKENALSEKENSVSGNIMSEDKHMGQESLEGAKKDAISKQSCDSLISVASVVGLQTNCDQVKNKSDIGSQAEKKQSTEQENDKHEAISICNKTIDSDSETCIQNKGDISPEMENINGKENVDVISLLKETSKKYGPSNSQYQNSCEVGNSQSNSVDLERSCRNIEITVDEKKQKSMPLLDIKDEHEGESADTACDSIDQSADGPVQQIENESKKNKLLMRNSDQETDETTNEGNLNNNDSTRRLLPTECNHELATIYTESPIKDHSADHSSDTSPTKKSPIFQRGLFPRIAIRDCGMRTIKKLKKQLFIEKEKREKKEQQERDKALGIKKPRQRRVDNVNNVSEFTKTCVSTKDIKLKQAQVYLVKINENMLSKYNVRIPSPHLCGSVGNNLNDVSLSYDEKSISEERNKINQELESQGESAVPFEGSIELQKSTEFSPDTDEHLQSSISGSTLEGTPSSEFSSVNIISNSRSSKKSPLQNISKNLKGNDNCLLDGTENKRGSKRRVSAHAFPPTKKQKQLEIKCARVHIWRIDNSILLKYGYDSQGLKIDNGAIVPSPSAHLSSVCSFVDNSQKALKTDILNSQIFANETTCAQPKLKSFSIPMQHKEQLATMQNSAKGEINDTKKSTIDSHKNTHSKTAQKKITNGDVPLSNRVALKNTSLNTEKPVRKTKCSVGKNNHNLKTLQVVVKRIDKVVLPSRMKSKKAPSLNVAKTTHNKTKSFVKKTDLDKKIHQLTVRKTDNVPISSHVLLNRCQRTTKSITKKKITVKDKFNLKTAQVILKNINNTPLSSLLLSGYLPTKTDNSARISKTKLDSHSSEILQEKSSPKKLIISQSKFCGGVDNQNEGKNKASSCEDVQDHSKENMCLNSDLKSLKGVRVNLYKLESMIQPKLLSSKPVFSS